jgi:hypothetical protein
VVVTSFPGPETNGSGGEIGESLAAPELLVVDLMTTLDLAVLLRAPEGGVLNARRDNPACKSP